MIALEELNALSPTAFVEALDGIFEHSPWVAERTCAARPFGSRLQLLEALCASMWTADAASQLALIRAHPELAGRAAIRQELTTASGHEQRRAGLDSCSPDEFRQLHDLNGAYREKFDFPFILAVRGHNPGSIIRNMQSRLDTDLESERRMALTQIGRIAGFRLAERVSSSFGAETMAMLDHLASFSEHEHGLACSFLTNAHRQTAGCIRDWMLAAGLDTHIDAIGNVVGRMRSNLEHAKTLITGSHYDTVIDGGRYDGRLGIVIPIVVATALRQSGQSLPFDLEIVAFADEEGVRFKSTFLGSSALAGSFDMSVLDQTDATGVTMRQALIDAGLEPEAIPQLARSPQDLLGFIEVHIEQGPVLLDEHRPLGVVSGIAGSVRYAVSVIGQAGHAGTVPMNLRHDAAVAAAEIVLAVERHCSTTPGLVGTVGKLEVPNGAINVIPGRCDLTLDLRAPDNARRDVACANVMREIEQISTRRSVRIDVRKMMQASAVPCSHRMQAHWSRAIRHVTGDSEVRVLPSGAGHDAMKMAEITDVGMLFVRCGNGGISHHPDETMTETDAHIAALAFESFLLSFGTDA